MPHVSLVTCVYNRESYVAEAARSVLGQTFDDWEWIIWDDGSTDDSIEILRDIVGDDPRVRWFAGENRGLTAALIDACAQARGEYLGWLDSDDRLDRRCLETTAAILDHRPRTGLVYTQHNIMDASGRIKGLGDRCRIPYSRDRMLLDFMVFHFRLVRRALYEQVGGFDTRYLCAQDYDLCLRLSEITEFRQVVKPLYDYRVHEASISLGRRVEQIDYAEQAVRAAMARRGLDEQFELKVDLVPRFTLTRIKS